MTTLKNKIRQHHEQQTFFEPLETIVKESEQSEEEGRLFSNTSTFKGTAPTDLSDNHDDYLYEFSTEH